MAWVAVNRDGTESIYNNRPLRREATGEWAPSWGTVNDDEVYLPSGAIEKLIGHRLTWEDDPVEL